jgi:hypothetical protein
LQAYWSGDLGFPFQIADTRRTPYGVCLANSFRRNGSAAYGATRVTQQSGTSGGSAAAGGIAFQTRVVAYYSVIILAESEGAPPLGLPANLTLDYVRCETGAPVDDFLVGTSDGGHIFGQAKRTVTLSRKPDSELASVVAQFVRQYLANRDQQNPLRPWNAPLHPERDRLVLFTSPEASATIRLALTQVLDRSRRLLSSQPFADAALNSDQRAALTVFESHAKRAWQDATGQSAADSELKRFASLCHTSVLSVETNGTDEQAANETLRRSILHAPDQAKAAWNSLISLAADLTQRRSGIDRTGLQQVLTANSILRKVQRSYSADVENLRLFTQTAMQYLGPLSRIEVGDRTIHLERASSAALWARAQHGSLLVVGDPGAGKSGCLNDLCQVAAGLGHDVVLILVDRFEAKNARSFSNELGLTHDFVQVLHSWPGNKAGFLVFDALDAARDERTATVIRDIIEQVLNSNSRWHVIASIRKYDLRHSRKLSRLFPGAGAAEFIDKEFQAISHLSVPLFSDEELVQLGAQSEHVRSILAGASPALRKLLRVPFNVRLMADLLSSGLSAREITPTRTQLDLLDGYWNHRVLREDQRGHDRERALHEVCVLLVDKLALQVATSSLSKPGTDLHDLLSQNVLAEWQPASSSIADRYRLAFSHHVLFDYAVARLLLRGESSSLLDRLNSSKDFVLFARPSIHLHLQHLWEADRTEFWTVALKILRAAEIPSIAGLLGPAVVATEAKDVDDLRYLLNAISASDADREAAITFLRHLVGALIADKSPLVGINAGPWCNLATELSLKMTPDVARIVRAILIHALESKETFSTPQLVAANAAGRALLTYCWRDVESEHVEAAVAVQAICRTIAGGHTETAEALRMLLKPEHLATRGYIELPWVTSEVSAIRAVDADLAADVYIGAFAFQDLSPEQTPMGKSRIMALVSNRRQDYEHAWWQLGEAFPQFLRDQPRAAMRALAGVVEAYVERELRPYGGTERRAMAFQVRGRRGSIQMDHSEVWDAGISRQHDAPIKMLDALYAEIGDPARAGGVDELLNAVVEFAKSAVFWKRLLTTAADVGAPLIAMATELCTVHPVLVGSDTSVAAGSFLQSRFSDIAPSERTSIEHAVVDIPAREPREEQPRAERIRARLLGCLPDALLSEPARRLLLDLRNAAAVPSNEPSFRFTEFSSSPVTTETHWEHLGVPVDEPGNREVLELTAPVEEFASRFLNSVPSKDDVSEALGHVDALHAVLEENKEGRHETALASGWSHLARACARIAHCSLLNCAEYDGQRTKELLLVCATKSQPPFDLDQEAQFEKAPSWGSPAARIDAAAGLMILAQRPNCNLEEVRAAILTLCRDTVSAVRFQVAQYLLTLYATSNEFFWNVAEQFAREESNSSVLLALLRSCLGRLARHAPNRVVALATSIMDSARVSERPEIQSAALSILSEMHVYQDHQQANLVVVGCIERTPKNPKVSRALVRGLRPALTYGTDAPEDAGIRRRAFNVIQSVLQLAQSELEAILAAHDGEAPSEWNDLERERAGDLGSVVNEVCSQLYFASGAFELRQGEPDKPLEPIRTRFYREAFALIDALLLAPMPAGVHHLMETLASYIDQAPEVTFLRVAAAVRNGAASGYHLESLAEGLIVRIVQRYLADYRHLLRDDDRCRAALMDVLNVFVSAGWPSARNLTYGLEEIFR